MSDKIINTLRNLQSRFKGQKLPEYWSNQQDFPLDGVPFFAKYLGGTLVEELDPEGYVTYSDGKCAKAVNAIVSMARSQFRRKLLKVSIKVEQSGVNITNLITGTTHVEIPIERVRYCAVDKIHHKVFAIIFRNTINETMECQAYLCANSNMATAVAYTLAQSFKQSYNNTKENPSNNPTGFSSEHSINNFKDKDETLESIANELAASGKLKAESSPKSQGNWEKFETSADAFASNDSAEVLDYMRMPDKRWDDFKEQGSVDDLLNI